MINKICIVCGQPILVERESVTNYDGSQPQHIKCYQKTATQPDHSKSSNLKKDIQDILGCTCAFNEEYDGKSYNPKTEEYEDCECVEKIPQIINLIESEINNIKLKGIEASVSDEDSRYYGDTILAVPVYDVIHHFDKKADDIKSKLIGEE